MKNMRTIAVVIITVCLLRIFIGICDHMLQPESPEIIANPYNTVLD